MKHGAMLDGRGPPGRSEILYDGEYARVTRQVVAGRPVIHKELKGPGAHRTARHEVAMLERLRGVAGIAQLAEAPRCPGTVIVADVGGSSLAGVAKPLATGRLIGLALALARAVAGMHRRGVMHRDITPANIVVSGAGTPYLVDFALATSFAELRPGFTPHSEIVGTLAYLAPEQTGRTGRPVDQRADLYALGATLYELATGAPPFGWGDPLRLTHAHLARVPVPPARVDPAVPAALSEIIMHLLEKEPDNRYQTAEGLAHDLERLRDTGAVRVGERDVPLRLLPPSRLVGRETEVAALASAFEEALSGRCRGVLISGTPGVGKTVLVDRLRPVVTGRDGWFVAGKFDQGRRDLECDALYQVFRAVGRLLVAEPERELAEIRRRILAVAGANASLLTAVVPEFAALLGVPPDPGDPLTAQARVQRVGFDVLRAVASRRRPVVIFIDDLQWAGRTPLGFVDLMLGAAPVEGLLLVAAYRDGALDAVRPLAAARSRWATQPGVRHLRLANLPVAGTVAMVAEMLHVDEAAAADLGEAVSPHTSGNPYETVELLNALRREGLLTAGAGWRWDVAEVRAHLGRPEAAGAPAALVGALPRRSRRMVEAMACLGGRAERGVLQTAVGEPAEVVERRLAPALDEGVLVLEPGVREAVLFRHDRIREAVLAGLDPRRRCAVQLAMARRLATVPELFAVAAAQYLAVVDTVDDAVDDAVERRQAVELFRRAADQSTLIGEYAQVNALLTAALRLIGPDETATLVEVRTGRHAALYSLGRLEEADEEYHAIQGLRITALQGASATAVQARSLTHRNRYVEAIGLGLETLRALGIAVPAADQLRAEADRRFELLYRWLEHEEDTEEPTRPEVTDPTLLAVARLCNAVLPAIYFAADHAGLAWLSLEALRIWIEHGPAGPLLGPASHVGFAAVTVRGDYAAGYRAIRRILALGEACGYEPDTSQVRFLTALLSCWFEPVEHGVRAGRQAREGLIAGGDLANAGYTYYPAMVGLLDCAPSLDVYVADVEAGLAFVRRTGDEHIGESYDSYRRLVAVLRGESTSAAGAAVPTERYAESPWALFHLQVTRAIDAAILDDPDALARCSAAAMSLLSAAATFYPTAAAHLLRGLALAGQARDGQGTERDALLAELDEVIGWLAARAADAPVNFRHLLRLLEAERAWAAGDFRAALHGFDAARHEVAARARPWHQALITEHAARFHLAHGLEHAGYELLAEARQQYLAWGATAKVDQLDWAYPALRRHDERCGEPHPRRATISTGTVDLLGILCASRALSAETDVEGLYRHLVQVLCAMTGATGVHLLLWSEDRHDWLLPAPDGDGGVVPAGGAGHERAVPMSVLRYIERTRELLVVGDATRDERFARDPYLTGLRCCSLLAVPILNRGMLRAVLLLENHLIHDAFTAERLDGVKLIAGQLAVSLDNAQLYTAFRRIADEQTALRRVATLVARGTAPEQLFAAVADEVGALFGAEGTAVVRFEPDGEVTVLGGHGLEQSTPGWRGPPDPRTALAAVRATGHAARYDADDRTPAAPGPDPGIRSVVAGPIEVEGRLWGAMRVGSRRRRLPPDTERRLADFTELIAAAIANAESRTELTASRARIVAAADQTRRRIERDLHDGAQQQLVSLALQIRAAQAALPPELHTVAAQLDRAVAGATNAVDELRETSRGIHPAILTDAGLGPALRVLARRSPIPVYLDVRLDGRLPEHVEVSAYYIIAEALTNAAKHAQASGVTVTVETSGGVVCLLVRDDGVGGADFARGTGLVGLKDRAEALGGRVTLDSPHGGGTTLRAELPLAPR
ncbi:AAA family ATPase [Dactylosporangium aurantiacum]|uniref:AAA family ATPase n=1 Tax=Dactylosporangium aurantiacum TaxID=35754 RepID=A0A9Q9MI40_9ACTN|nr:AAA family ATPase [Dactylosporangium aurantiacum]MDG6107027.1 AAA family ATPase [Dactylosporangium aurantiacum]UWZ50622.1 AAA family ATPase [Dactylosporangium aurantiacum]